MANSSYLKTITSLSDSFRFATANVEERVNEHKKI